jgi:hypothetical protein
VCVRERMRVRVRERERERERERDLVQYFNTEITILLMMTLGKLHNCRGRRITYCYSYHRVVFTDMHISFLCKYLI